mmetsp:Transcript_68531/g.100312  ORF Transcript_68531/g.100312 Transcript_68531/m.100312 type:complete len:294 (-) Transcript_68531:1212-2093(-)
MSSLWTRGRVPATFPRFAPLAHTIVAAANGVGQVRDTTRAGQRAEDSAHAQSVPALQHAACPSRPSQSHASHGRGSSPAPFWSSSAHLGRAHGRSSDSSGGMKPCLRSLIALRTKRQLSGSFQGDSEAAASALSSVTTTAKVLNEGLDPMATEAFVDSLSQKASVELLDLILKKRGESSSDTEDDVFVTGGAKIRLEDYEKLDANGDGLISREELETYLNSQKAPVSAPTQEQLMMLATSAAVPFVGFGFMDNAIMIMAGEVSCMCVYVSCVATSNTISCVRRCLCRRAHTSE